MVKLTLRVACVILLVTCVQGCSFFNLKCKAEEFIQKEFSQLIGKAQLAFEQAMDHVFDQDITPLLEKAEAAIDAGIDKVDKDVNETINHIETSIEKIIHDAAQTANALANNVTHDIEEIIREAASAMEQVENTFYRDASRLLAEINQIVQKGQCMEAGGAKQLQDQIYRLLKSLDPFYRFSSCWRSLGFKASMSLEDLTDIQLYNYQKECTLLNKITPNTPINGPGGILETYAQGQLYAAEYYCIGETADAPAFEDVLSKEWLWWGVQYNAWKKIGIASENHSHHTVKAGQGKAVKDDPCGTPVECYAQAIEALKEAEQKILSLQSSLSSLNQTVIGVQKQVLGIQKQVLGNQKQVNASIVGLKANVSANGQSIGKNINTIMTNKNAIATNKEAINSKLSTLAAYPCKCVLIAGTICTSAKTVSQGYVIANILQPPQTKCCELCMGTAEDARKSIDTSSKERGRSHVPGL